MCHILARVRETIHDIPANSKCKWCHKGEYTTIFRLIIMVWHQSCAQNHAYVSSKTYEYPPPVRVEFIKWFLQGLWQVDNDKIIFPLKYNICITVDFFNHATQLWQCSFLVYFMPMLPVKSNIQVELPFILIYNTWEIYHMTYKDFERRHLQSCKTLRVLNSKE